MSDDRCYLENYCGRAYRLPDDRGCWCLSCDESRERVKDLADDLERWQNYVASLEEVCSPEQLREARKAAGNT